MVDSQSSTQTGTQDADYSGRLLREEGVWWKRRLDVQLPYRWNLRRLNLGFTLDLGCGLGRNLLNLNGNGVGIDHNPHSVDIARSRGLRAFTHAEFQASEFNKSENFDSILFSHVAEHMLEQDAIALLGSHIYLLKPHGKVILIAPQEYGFRADPTHVQFMDFDNLREISRRAGLSIVRQFSFPFPRFFGGMFRYNEFILISEKP
jgi:SAM-dependent methyltransferase